MMAIDLNNIHKHTASEIADSLSAGNIGLRDVWNNLNQSGRQQLYAELDNRDERSLIEDIDWLEATSKNALGQFLLFIEHYDRNGEDEYRGKHVVEAKMAIERLSKLKEQLLESMRTSPTSYNEYLLKALIDGLNEHSEIPNKLNDLARTFVSTGQTITLSDLQNYGLVPMDWTLDFLLSHLYPLDQLSLDDIGGIPITKRHDVLFLGAPMSGKTTVEGSIMAYMQGNQLSKYITLLNHNGKDLVKNVYDGMIDASLHGQYPSRTSTDSLALIQLDIQSQGKVYPTTFVDLSGFDIAKASLSGYRGDKAWLDLGAGTCIASPNRKVVYILVDYSLSLQSKGQLTQLKQVESLQSLLRVLTSDGTGDKQKKGCTMSRIDHIAVIVTKCDLMATNDRQQRTIIAQDFLKSNYESLMADIRNLSQIFGINKANNYEPSVFTFSTGLQKVGNKYISDSTDATILTEHLLGCLQNMRDHWWKRL